MSEAYRALYEELLAERQAKAAAALPRYPSVATLQKEADAILEARRQKDAQIKAEIREGLRAMLAPPPTPVHTNPPAARFKVRDTFRKLAEIHRAKERMRKEAGEQPSMYARKPTFSQRAWNRLPRTAQNFFQDVGEQNVHRAKQTAQEVVQGAGYLTGYDESKPFKDNMRGYAETTGEIAGGTAGAIGGGLGGGALAGPVGLPLGATFVGYGGGKLGKGFARNAFNYFAGDNAPAQSVDSFGRNTGFGLSNAEHGHDFMPRLADLGYGIPMLGGALNTPLSQWWNHGKNLLGRPVPPSVEELFTPVYQSLPWGTRWAVGPQTPLRYQVNLNRPTTLERWQHARALNRSTGQFDGVSNADGTSQRIPARNHLYQLDTRVNDNFLPGMTPESYMAARGIPEDSAKRIIKNMGERADTFGDAFSYLENKPFANIPQGTTDKRFTLTQPAFVDIRALPDSLAAKHSLTGARFENGKMVPVPKDDGNSPASTNILNALKAEIETYPDNRVLRDWYERHFLPKSPQNKHPEITIPISKLPTQGYTKSQLDGDVYYPWRAVDATPLGSKPHLQRIGLGAPTAQGLQQVKPNE